MSIITGLLQLDNFNGVKLKRISKEKFLFLEEVSTKVDTLKSISKKNELFVAIDTIDFSIQKLIIPKIKDKSTRLLVIKNKLSQMTETGVNNIDEYKILPVKVSEEANQEEYNVFLIPLDILKTLEEEVLHSLEVLTLSIFSISGLISVLKLDGNVLFAFADDYKLIVAFFIEGRLEYARTVSIPAYIATEEELTNFFYENINLTYIYVSQNLRKQADFLVFSGGINENLELMKQVYEFSKTSLISLNLNSFVKGCSSEVLNKHAISIGNLFLDTSLDIRPDYILEEKNFKKVSKYLFLVAVVLNLMILPLTLYKYVQVKALETELITKVDQLNRKIEFLEKNSSVLKDIEYYKSFLDALYEKRKKNILAFMLDLKPLLEFHKFENIKANVEKDGLLVELSSTVSFPSVIQASVFKDKINRIINRIEKRDKTLKVVRSISIDINRSSIVMNIRFFKSLDKSQR